MRPDVELIQSCSVVEQNFCPLTKRISSLVEISSLVKTTSPLNQLLVLWTVANLIFVRSKVRIIELLLPGFDVVRSGAVKEINVNFAFVFNR